MAITHLLAVGFVGFSDGVWRIAPALAWIYRWLYAFTTALFKLCISLDPFVISAAMYLPPLIMDTMYNALSILVL